MSTSRVEVLLWAQRIIARKGAEPHELLELPATATVEDAQEAFHKLARIAHPDLHRTTLDAGELEKVTTAYAYVAAAYQAMRVGKARGTTGKVPTAPAAPEPAAPRAKRPSNVVVLPGGAVVRGTSPTRPPPLKPAGPAAAPAPPPAKPGRAAASTPADATPAVSGPTGPSASAQMNSKALVHFRKAEMALRQGDLRMALLQLKMAIAADPGSAFLRQALAEVETELKGT